MLDPNDTILSPQRSRHRVDQRAAEYRGVRNSRTDDIRSGYVDSPRRMERHGGDSRSHMSREDFDSKRHEPANRYEVGDECFVSYAYTDWIASEPSTTCKICI
jgi:hypothetical protein